MCVGKKGGVCVKGRQCKKGRVCREELYLESDKSRAAVKQQTTCVHRLVHNMNMILTGHIPHLCLQVIGHKSQDTL